ncbi:MAG: ligase-associated DNA damage response endonuclease PdeM [Alphaproteobacteria bacterium]|nr:MAG: ligase-associated DNA damage response endonuclease PdeM [Alphaproteobacteria bacterium]
MRVQEFQLAGAVLTARPSGALWWAARRLLCVADLHLGKSERFARRNGCLLPPYETRETLDRLAAEIDRLDPAAVVCLGDSFDDDAAAEGLSGDDLARLLGLIAGRRWIWVSGNHDPAPLTRAGEIAGDFVAGGITFRHEARQGASAEVSGHWHPKIGVTLRGRRVTRPCFLVDEDRAILPAFGAYTGGLSARHPALRPLMGPHARAILTGRVALSLPLDAALAE